MYQNKPKFQQRGGWRGQRFPRRSKKPPIDASLFVKKATTAVDQIGFIPVHSFTEFALSDQLLRNVTGHGYQTPTPIQDQAIPVIMSGKDIVGIAQTGTGKTAAFLLPLIHKVFLDRMQKILVIVPTRELAIQIENELRKFTRQMNVYSALCIGGVDMRRQIYALGGNPNFVIGTPGRLKDLEKQGKIHFSAFKTIVLDEVDRMLDMGFIADINYIITKLPSVRHSLFFSATIPPAVRDIMGPFLTNPETISIKTQESSERVNQDIIKTNGKPKIDVLHELLIQDDFRKVLLFGRTKWGIERLSRDLMNRGFKVAAIHGNKRQSQRQRALEDFKNNHIQVLLATDIASRGIDVLDITHVINYDLPESYEDYVHRIGRTGRADKFGTALTFVD